MNLDEQKARLWCDHFAKPYLHWSSGAIAVIATTQDAIYESYGRTDQLHPEPPNENTLFEIGSITKLFTCILLAKFVLEGRLELDAPIGDIDRRFKGTPIWITPRALATHTSGLPRIPFTFIEIIQMGPKNPYANFTQEDLIEWMARYRPSKRPRTGHISYSNLGMGLLGCLLGMIAGSSYSYALQHEVLEPLSLKDTALQLKDDHRLRLATPHHKRGKPTPPWDFDVLAGAGALRATARDLVCFARSVMRARKGDGLLHSAINMSLEVQVPGYKEAPDQCLGWVKHPGLGGGPSCFNHDGGTLGSMSSLYVSPTASVAAIVLANYGTSLPKMLSIAWSEPTKIMDEIISAQSPNVSKT